MADTETYVVMLVVTGQTEEVQWFDYVTSYFAETTRVEWDAGTMLAVLPSEDAGFLIAHGYARPMTDAEIETYTAPEESPPPPPVKPAKAKKETANDQA